MSDNVKANDIWLLTPKRYSSSLYHAWQALASQTDVMGCFTALYSVDPSYTWNIYTICSLSASCWSFGLHCYSSQLNVYSQNHKFATANKISFHFHWWHWQLLAKSRKHIHKYIHSVRFTFCEIQVQTSGKTLILEKEGWRYFVREGHAKKGFFPSWSPWREYHIYLPWLEFSPNSLHTHTSVILN